MAYYYIFKNWVVRDRLSIHSYKLHKYKPYIGANAHTTLLLFYYILENVMVLKIVLWYIALNIIDLMILSFEHKYYSKKKWNKIHIMILYRDIVNSDYSY